MHQQANPGGVGAAERAIAAIGLVLSSPATLASALAIKAASRGPVLYRAPRAGRDNVPFTMYKLRTMRIGTEDAGAITGGRDPRVFRVGTVLRALKLDELPQLINIVRGEMSFVGPRPEAISVVDGHYTGWMLETLWIPPGIVGPGSLSYFAEEDQLPDDPAAAARFYVQTVLPRKLARDLVFVRRPTARYRLELLLRTALSIVRLRGMMSQAVEREEREAAAILAEVHHTGQRQHVADTE